MNEIYIKYIKHLNILNQKDNLESWRKIKYEKRCYPYFLEMALSEQRLPQNVRRPVRAEVPRRPQSLLQGEEKANCQQMIAVAVASRPKFGGWNADKRRL